MGGGNGEKEKKKTCLFFFCREYIAATSPKTDFDFILATLQALTYTLRAFYKRFNNIETEYESVLTLQKERKKERKKERGIDGSRAECAQPEQ